jgi:glutamyl-Q tRNA(Asp) synthetase
MTFRTRFAPSPTGPLHLGHAYSALLAHDLALENGGDFLLRIEDIDRSRARSEWEAQIYDDLEWLGLWWPEPAMRQSDRFDAYQHALDGLWERELLFPCDCNRKDILSATAAPQEGAPLIGPDGIVYPGTCRHKRDLPWWMVERPRDKALRLDVGQASFAAHRFQSRIETPDGSGNAYASFMETGCGPNGETGLIDVPYDDVETNIGAIVLARRDMGTSYHLSVVLDDAAQGITHVVRGQDLFEATKIHILLQHLLGLPTPTYHHHALIRDDAGKRLAKRDDARAISKYRADGCTPADIRQMVGL